MTLQIELLNPKARSVLDSLAELNLIKIQESTDSRNELTELLQQFRSADEVLSLDEITAEIETVRTERYEQK